MLSRKLLPLLFASFIFCGELEVDGNLNVSGTIQSQTIDSLLQVIAQLQAQIALLQGGAENKLETRVYEIPNIIFECFERSKPTQMSSNERLNAQNLLKTTKFVRFSAKMLQISAPNSNLETSVSSPDPARFILP